jgi:ketose-bisphosphate aldolases
MEKNLRYWLQDADQNGYAIPAFNFNDCWDLMAIVRAAEQERSPIMVSSVGYVVDSLGLENCAALGKVAMKQASVPIFLHLDHQTSVDVCKRAIDLGYPSVMIDASSKSLEENIQTIREVVDYAHPHGTVVEGEIGRIRGKDDEGVYLGDDFLVQTADAVALAQESGVDTLAIGIGTQHGFYKGEPHINMERLSDVNASIKTPLVLHGGTGIGEDIIHEAISRGINRINVGTAIRYTYMKTMAKTIEEQGPAVPPGKLVQPALQEIESVVRAWIRTCGSNGRA